MCSEALGEAMMADYPASMWVQQVGQEDTERATADVCRQVRGGELLHDVLVWADGMAGCTGGAERGRRSVWAFDRRGAL